jgi:RNA polymerase sigma factor (sigma-70 family)
VTDVETVSRYAPLTDGQLVAACRANDADAWAALLTRFSRLVYSIPRRAGLSSEAANDVFQDVFARLLEHIDDIEQPERVKAWIVTTTRRATFRALRPISQTVGGEDVDRELSNLPDVGPLPGEMMERLEQWHALRVAVEQLDARCATLIQLLFYAAEPPSYVELGEQLGIPAGSIGPTRARCLEKLRKVLERTRAI